MRAGVHGALHISLAHTRELSEGQRRWLQSVVSQCALALERSQLYDEEQRLRERSERLQRATAKLSNAVTQAEVAEVVVEAAAEAVDAASASLYAVGAEREVAHRLAMHGDAVGDGADAEIPLGDDSPLAQVVRSGGWWSEAPTDGAAQPVNTSVGVIVPLVAGRRIVGALELGWADPTVLGSDHRVLLQTLAGQGAQALDRA